LSSTTATFMGEGSINQPYSISGSRAILQMR
jgi:hypothetical protein